jgi:glycosidase
MFWWVGMKNPKLQLVVHGNKIAERKVTLNYPGVRLIRTNKVENPNYLFLDLQIASTTKAGNFPILFRDENGKTVSYNYVLKTRDQSPNRIQGVTSKDLIYLIMPDRFANGDKSNDVVAGMEETALNRDSMFYRHGGDLQGIIDHLDYLKDLGITAIWNTPEIENDQPTTSYHGYAVTDHYKIDPRYGTNELYKTFVDKCHAAGLKVIKDIVHNHIGSRHWTMKDPPSKDWVHQWPSFTKTTYRDQTQMDPYGSAIDKKLLTDGWFDYHMPDLNQNNSFVQNFLTQNHIWWIEYAGIDGLRLDTYHYNDLNYMADWAQKIKDEFPRINFFGETLVGSVINEAFFTEGKTINQKIDTHLPGVTDVQIKDAIYEALNGQFDWTTGVSRLYSVLANDFVYKNPENNVIFLDNHDMSRFYSLIGVYFQKYK